MNPLIKRLQLARRKMQELITDHHAIGFRLVDLHQEIQNIEVELNPSGEQLLERLPVQVDTELEMERENETGI